MSLFASSMRSRGACALTLSILTGLPVLPAMAEDYTWQADDGMWSNAASWSPDGIPYFENDRAYIGHEGGSPVVTLPYDLANLLNVLELHFGGRLDNDGYTVRAHNLNIYSGIAQSRLILSREDGTEGNKLWANHLLIGPGSTLEMINDPNAIIWHSLDLRDGATVRGAGELRAAHLAVFDLDGTIKPAAGETIEIAGLNELAQDIDGSDDRAEYDVTANGSSVRLNMSSGMTDDFSGSFEVGPNAWVEWVQGDFPFDGELLLDGAGGVSRFLGDIDLKDGGVLYADTLGQINGSVDMPAGHILAASGGRLTITGSLDASGTADIDTNGQLVIGGQLTLDDVGVTGDGMLEVDAGTLTRGSVHINLPGADLDLDGASEVGALVVEGDGFTRVTADAIENGENGRFDGLVEVEGSLWMDLLYPWTMRGTLRLDATAPGASSQPRISGSTLVLDPLSTVIAKGTTEILSTVVMNDGVQVSVANAGDRLSVDDITMRDVEVEGAGEFQLTGQMIVTGTTLMAPAMFDWDGPAQSGSTVVEPGASFQIAAPAISLDPANDGFDGSVIVRGDLRVNTALPWRHEGQMTLMDGGRVFDTEMVVTEGGHVHATSGTSQIFADAAIVDDGQYTVEPGTTLEQWGDLTLDARSTSVMEGTGTFIQRGDLDAVTGGIVNDVVYDWDGHETFPSDTVVRSDAALYLFVSAIETTPGDGHDGTITIETGGSLAVSTDADAYRIDGTLEMTGSASLSGDDLDIAGTLRGGGSFFGVLPTNDGLVELTADGGGFTFWDSGYVQTGNGTLRVELAGTQTGVDHGSIVCRDNWGLPQAVDLGGTLEIVFANGYVPAAGDAFELMQFSVANGWFDTIDAPGFEIWVDDSASTKKLMATYLGNPCPGDVNGDDSVDFNDLIATLASWGDCDAEGGCPADFDGDGVVGFNDLLTVLSNWGICSGA